MTLRFVATDSRIGHSEYPVSGDSIGDEYTIVIAGGDVTRFKLAFDGWFRTGGDEVSMSSPYTVSVSVQNAAFTSQVAVTRAGATVWTVSPGDNDLQTDWIMPAALGFTGGVFPKGTILWYKGLRTYPSGGLNGIENGFEADGSSFPAYPNSRCIMFSRGSAQLTPVTTLGHFGIASGSGVGLATFGYRPHAIGEYASGDPLVMVGIIDSINATGLGSFEYVGAGAAGNLDGNPQLGGMGRVAAHTCTGGPIAYFNASKNSARAQNYAKTAHYFQYCNVLFDELGANDMGDGLAVVQARELAIWSAARAAGITKIVRVHVFPRTNTSDNFTTASGQSYQTGQFTPGGDVTSFNTWMDARLADRTIDAVLPLAGLRDPSDPFKWKTDGITGQLMTADGTHPSTNATANFAGPELAAFLNTLAGGGTYVPPSQNLPMRSGSVVIMPNGYVVPLL